MLMEDLNDGLTTAAAITCDKCGADLAFDAALQEVNCNFCGHALDLEDSRRVRVVEPDGMVPFRTDGETFRASALRWLVTGDYIPVDVLAQADFADNRGLFVPCLAYNGNFSADWSAQVGTERRETVLVERNGKLCNETRTHIDYHPVSGRAHDTFAYLACASRHLPSEFKSFVEEAGIQQAKPNDERLSLGFMMEMHEADIDQDGLFKRRCGARLSNRVDHAVQGQITGSHVRDVRSSFTYRFNTVGSMLVPVWLLSYEYGVERFTIIMDGQDTGRIIGSRPHDAEQQRQARVPFYVAGGIGVATLGAVIAGANVDPSLAPIAQAGAVGLFAATGTALFGAVLNRWRLLSTRQALRSRALEAHSAGSTLDVAAELDEMQAHRFSPARLWRGSLVLAGVAALTVSTASYLSPDRTVEPAPQVAAADSMEDAPILEAPVTADPQPQLDEQAPAEMPTESAELAADTQMNAQPAQPEPTPSPAYAAAYAPTYASPSPLAQPSPDTRVSDLAAQTLAEARDCMGRQNFDCAEANARTVLRLQPGQIDAAAMLRTIAARRREALASDWNAQ